MIKYKLSKDYKFLIIEHQDDGFSSEQEIKVSTVLKVLQPVLKGFKPVRFVQLKNPMTRTYVLIDREIGSIVSHHPRKDTPYKNVPIASKGDPVNEGFLKA